MRLPTLRFLLPLLAAAALPAQADSIDSLQALTQDEFHSLVQDLGAATSYKYLASAAPLGLAGFDIAFASAFTHLEHRDLLRKATSDSSVPAYAPTPGIRVAKGLPFGFDLGATLAAVPNSGGRIAGAELRWAALEGGLVAPAIGLRLSYTQLTGVSQLSLNNTALDVAISKGFPIITPYAGAGVVRTQAKANGVPTLASETTTQGRGFAGAHLNFGLMDVTLEGDKTGSTTSWSARLGFRF